MTSNSGTGAGGEDPYADTDATSTGYGPAAVNGILQGEDTTSRFRFVFPKPAGVADGTALTATARDGSNNTSEFSGVVAVISTMATRSCETAASEGLDVSVAYVGGTCLLLVVW